MQTSEVAALCSALLWTFSAMLWGDIKLSALTLNTCKNCVGFLFLVVHWLVFATVTGNFQFTTSVAAWGWVGLSGVAGLVIGDTLYFRSLQILGARRSFIIACFSPLFAALLGYQFLDQQLGWTVMLGISLTMAGIIAVVADKRGDVEAPGLVPGKFIAGVACGIGGAFCQAVGGLFSSRGLQHCDPLEATVIRLLIAAIITSAVLLSQSKHRTAFLSLFRSNDLKKLLLATTLGTWLGIWMCQVAYSGDNLAIAQTLLSTCPLFAIPVVWIFHGHRATWQALASTIIALVGIWLTVKN
jgi:drug/metabolite transporter (DMT)-like permease